MFCGRNQCNLWIINTLSIFASVTRAYIRTDAGFFRGSRGAFRAGKATALPRLRVPTKYIRLSLCM
jgi:hypothetical protein